jgi:hypothetical protein
MKIIFVSYMPLRNKFYRDFYLQELLDHRHEVEYWDLTQIYFPKINMPDLMESTIVHEFNSLSEIKKRLQITNTYGSLFIPYMTYNYKVIKLFYLLTKFNVTLGFFRIGLFPVPPRTTNLEKINSLSEFISFGKLSKYILRKLKRRAFLYKKYGLIKDYDIVFAAGEVALSSFNHIKKLIPINLNDYDNYLSIKDQKEKVIEDRYCVFHDEDFINHPDRKMLGWKKLDALDYYSKINNFFSMVEEQFDCKVIIAASPKSDYSENPFIGREIITHQTNQLVKDCLFSIIAASTSVSYPVSYTKQIIFFSYSGFSSDGSGYNIYSKYFADFLGSSHYEIDDVSFSTKLKIRDIDVQKYDHYKYQYLTSLETELMQTKDIFLKTIDQLSQDIVDANQ